MALTTVLPSMCLATAASAGSLHGGGVGVCRDHHTGAHLAEHLDGDLDLVGRGLGGVELGQGAV